MRQRYCCYSNSRAIRQPILHCGAAFGGRLFQSSMGSDWGCGSRVVVSLLLKKTPTQKPGGGGEVERLNSLHASRSRTRFTGSNTGPLLLCESPDEADSTFTDVFVYQLRVATDFPLPMAAPATSIQDKGNNSERSGPLGSPALLEHALLWSYLCFLWETRETSQSPKSIFLREYACVQKTKCIFSTCSSVTLFVKNWSFQFFMLHQSGPPVIMTFSSFPWNEFKSWPFLQGFYSPFHQCVYSRVCPTFLLPFSPRASPERSWYFLPPTGSTYHELCQTPPQFSSLQPAPWWLSQVCYLTSCAALKSYQQFRTCPRGGCEVTLSKWIWHDSIWDQ